MKNWIKNYFPLVLITSTLLALSVNVYAGNPPTAVLDKDVYVGNEGEIILFDASGSSDPDGDVLHYRWDTKGDGIWNSWSTQSWLKKSYGDDYTGTISVKVSDGLLTDIATAKVNIKNVAPTVNAGSDMEVIVSKIVKFKGSFYDPGSADSHSIIWDFDDGGSKGYGLNPTHIFIAPGEYNVVLTIIDDDGGKGHDTVLVNVVIPKKGIDSCDENGILKDEFWFPYDKDKIFVRGWGFPSEVNIPIYMVEDVTNWFDGLSLSSLTWVSGVLVKTDSDGGLSPTLLMEPRLPPGLFDIFADVNDNGFYDADVDFIDNNNVYETAGFFVIPEFPLGTIVALAAFLSALFVIRKR